MIFNVVNYQGLGNTVQGAVYLPAPNGAISPKEVYCMKKYEVIYIVRPTVDEEGLEAVVSKFENLVKNNGATVEKIDRWGKKRLAYEIKDFTEGFYVLMYFTAEPQVVFELERVMKITDEIIRHMVIKEDE